MVYVLGSLRGSRSFATYVQFAGKMNTTGVLCFPCLPAQPARIGDTRQSRRASAVLVKEELPLPERVIAYVICIY
ncbi:MAG: hypothetical protein IPL27_25085 [Lewinellaceae bacterium]|nr:hypothetical protein [Lewinellaceae bacterium]